MYSSKFSRSGTLFKLLKLCERITYRLADTVITTNESYANIVESRGSKNKEDVFIVRSGPDLKRIHPVQADPTLRGSASYMVGYVGVMGSQEGLDKLLEVIRYCIEDLGRTDIRWVLCGDGPERSSLIKLSEQMGLAEHVIFTGRIPDSELMAWLSTADVCVAPDPPNEHTDKSTMNKILEYMALVKPIVQFETTEGRVSAGEASLYAKSGAVNDFADKIIELLNEPEKRHRMGEIGRERINNIFAWQHQVHNLHSAYEHAFKNG